MQIVIASSECTPFAKTGGLADVVGSIPVAIEQLGHECVVIMPLYACVKNSEFTLRDTNLVLDVPIDTDVLRAKVFQTRLPQSTVKVYLIDYPEFFDRPSLYGTKEGDYADNGLRFIFFQRALMETCCALNLQPDIMHCNDWQTGLLPLYIKTLYAQTDTFKNTKCVLTIHNLAYQGVFWHLDWNATGLDWAHYNWEEYEWFDQIGMLKGAIVHSDCINTVSPTYAKEIQTEQYGCGLNGLLTERSDVLFGILNGVDTNTWSPEKDRCLITHFSARDKSGKASCKVALQAKCDLPIDADAPLFAFIGRLDPQKGIELIVEALPNLLEHNVQVVILGTGAQKYHEMLESLEKKYHEQLKVILDFNNTLAHTIEAGADFFLMPSLYEPCGLNQMYSMIYGTLPIVHRTGGLADTVIDIGNSEEPNKSATGICFEPYTDAAFSEALERALDLYNNHSSFNAVSDNAMLKDFSWNRAASEYIELYETAIQLKQTLQTGD